MKVLNVRYGDPSAARLFTQSLKDTGFAVLNHHPIPPELTAQVFADWARFFASEEKHEHTFEPKLQSGYFPFRTERAKDSKVKDLKEFFHYYPWTQLPKSLSPATIEFAQRMSGLAAELLSWIDEHTPTEIRATFSMPLSKMIENSSEILLRPIHYPPLKGDEEDGAIRAAAHEDINLITLLPAATAPGLQVKDLAGNWHDVDCDPGNIVINSGDMLQMATQGYYVSTTHRVINPKGGESGKPRYAMPLFLHPKPEVRLSEKYTARGYLEERLREIGLLSTSPAKA